MQPRGAAPPGAGRQAPPGFERRQAPAEGAPRHKKTSARTGGADQPPLLPCLRTRAGAALPGEGEGVRVLRGPPPSLPGAHASALSSNPPPCSDVAPVRRRRPAFAVFFGEQASRVNAHPNISNALRVCRLPLAPRAGAPGPATARSVRSARNAGWSRGRCRRPGRAPRPPGRRDSRLSGCPCRRRARSDSK